MIAVEQNFYQWQYSLDDSSWEDITIINGYFDATAAQYQPGAITNANISSISSFTLSAAPALVAADFIE